MVYTTASTKKFSRDNILPFILLGVKRVFNDIVIQVVIEINNSIKIIGVSLT
jgi:hypothetical protein